MPKQAHDVPTKATAEKGEVMIDGPEGLAVSFTADAALKSAAAIADAADEAHRQAEEDAAANGGKGRAWQQR